MLFWMVLAVLCIAYWLLIVVYAGIGASFAWIWPILAVLCAGLALLVRKLKSTPDFFPKWLLVGGAGIGICALLAIGILTGIVLRGMHAKETKGMDYIVVLGAQVRGTKPSRALSKRLEKALEIAKKDPDVTLILSGGQGAGEDITEAKCMEEWLLENGLEADRLVLEEKSTSTMENLTFSDQLTGCAAKKTGILTNDFHVARALLIAEKAGYLHRVGIAAKGDPLMEVHYILREDMAVLKALWLGHI